ncbi:MAG: hypothetical protein AAFO07_24375 [Bacteroidota bacterium]
MDITEGEFDKIYFYRSSFLGIVVINDYNILGNENSNLSINGIDIHSNNFEKNFSIALNRLDQLYLSNNNFRQQLSFSPSRTGNSMVKPTSISITGCSQGNVILEGLFCYLDVSDINFGTIFLKNSKLESMVFKDFQNKGSITLTNIQPGHYLVIQNAVTGDLNFLNFDINSFKEIVIADSKIDGINLNNYPEKVLSYNTNPKIGYGIKEKRKRIPNLKNVYNQLKNVARKKGDIDAANKYQSMEYGQLLFSKRFGFDSVILFLNLASNNNGRSWFRGVLFTFMTSIIFFIFYLNALKVPLGDLVNFEDFVVFLSTFPKLELEKYEESNNQWNIRLVIWLSRIFIGYGVYQTIAAFRKYGKG